MARVEKTVFLSYRRTNASWALAIYQNLTANGFDVFFDYQGIASGDFESIILENIRARAHFLIVLTPSALERCGDPGDWLRREIEEAIECRRNIIPLMLDGFGFGTPALASQLIGRLAALKAYNGLSVPIDYFDAAMVKLREKFLNVPVDAVLHPASAFARGAANEQQTAADALPVVQEAELTAQDWFERGVSAPNPDEAYRCYSYAIRLKPDYADAYYNRGAARDAKGDRDGAQRDYAKVRQLKPDYPGLPEPPGVPPSVPPTFVRRVRVLLKRPIYKVPLVIAPVLLIIALVVAFIVLPKFGSTVLTQEDAIVRFFVVAFVVAFISLFCYMFLNDRVDKGTTDKIKELSRSYLEHMLKQDAGKLAGMAETPFFFGETPLSHPDDVQQHFQRIFDLSQTDLSKKIEKTIGLVLYRGAHFSKSMVMAGDVPGFDLFNAAEIKVTLEIYSSEERQKASGPEPTLDLRKHAARAEIRVKGFDVGVTYLYFVVREAVPYFRGVLLR